LKKKIGVLTSGGLDSAALIGHYLKKGFEVWPIYIRCGLRWEAAEQRAARKFINALSTKRARKLASIHLLLEHAYDKNWSTTGKIPGARSSDKAVYLPARNLLLVMKAVLYLFPHKIYRLALATLNGNPFPDGRRSYFDSLQKVLSASFGKRIRIETPFRNSVKKKIILSNRAFPLYLSLSCLRPTGGMHCGRCNKCAERKKAFRQAGLKDLTNYRF
jgi:7-cyano-7-deazaguanine synthase